MSKPANKTLIGAFVLGAIGLAVAGILIFGAGRFFTSTYNFVTYFDGSVKGLQIGAPVAFRGVKVGQVKDIHLYYDPEEKSFLIPVIIELEPNRVKDVGFSMKRLQKEDYHEYIKTLVNRGLRAQLQSQSYLTGQLFVDLDFYPEKKAKLVGSEIVGPDIEFPEIPTIPTPFEQIQQTLQDLPVAEIADKFLKAVEGVERTVNSPEIERSLRYFRQTMKDLRNLVRKVEEHIDPLAANLQETLTDTRSLVNDIDRQVEPLASNLGQTIREAETTLKQAKTMLETLNSHIEPLVASIATTSDSADVAFGQATQTLASFQDFATGESVLSYEIINMLKELTSTARSLRILTDYLERHPEALVRGKAASEAAKERK